MGKLTETTKALIIIHLRFYALICDYGISFRHAGYDRWISGFVAKIGFVAKREFMVG